MSKERYNQIIDDAYKNFLMTSKKMVSKEILEKFLKHTPNIHKVEFIDKIKTDERFSERWGLKIEEQELSRDERIILMNKKIGVTDTLPQYYNTDDEMDKNNVPTKVITVTYNNETIEIYDND
jgi:hypothetical protein